MLPKALTSGGDSASLLTCVRFWHLSCRKGESSNVPPPPVAHEQRHEGIEGNSWYLATSGPSRS